MYQASMQLTSSTHKYSTHNSTHRHTHTHNKACLVRKVQLKVPKPTLLIVLLAIERLAVRFAPVLRHLPVRGPGPSIKKSGTRRTQNSSDKGDQGRMGLYRRVFAAVPCWDVSIRPATPSGTPSETYDSDCKRYQHPMILPKLLLAG